MAIVDTDWSVDRQTGNIRYIGADHNGVSPEPSYATVIQLHRWLQDLADDPEYTGDDEVDIINTNPSSRSTDNIITLLGSYNIDDTAAEHLYDGSIIQKSGTEIYDGIVNFGNADVQIQIHQNGAVLADDWWNFGGAGLNADATQGISHRFMIKVRDNTASPAADIDNRKLIGTCRRFGYTYSEFKINATARGNNVLALSDSTDLNNQTPADASPISAGVSQWTSITNLNEGYSLLDVDNDTTNEAYYSEWDRSTYTINQFYERMKWLTRDGSSSTLYGLNGELFRGITHEIVIDNVVNTFAAYGLVSWSTGTGQMLAINSTGSPEPTKMWIQLLTGTAPTDGMTITMAGVSPIATADVNVTVTERTISTPFVGQSTGSALIGAYGIGVQTTDLSSADTLFDLDNNPVYPPNNVTFTVGGLIAGEDYVFVGPWDGSSLDADGNPEVNYDQLRLATTLSGAAESAVVVTGTIPSDTPSSGTLRVETDSGFYQLCAYSSFSGSTFTLSATEDFSGDNATATTSPSKNVFITYLDQLADGSPLGSTVEHAFTFVYNVDRKFVIKVRDGGGTPIKEYIAQGTMSSTGGSATAIRTVDA